jgi:hypothetical protein
MIKDYGGCAQCASSEKVINNFGCANFCSLPTKNFNGICQQCIAPSCDASIPNFAFTLSKGDDGKFMITMPQPLFQNDGSLFRLGANSTSIFKTSVNGTSVSYVVEYSYVELNAGIQITINPETTLYDVTIVVEPLLDGKNFYTKEKNELVVGISKLNVAVVQTKDMSLDAIGRGLSIFLLVIFFTSIVVAVIYIFLVTSNNYMKWRLLHSVNYIHLLALLYFVNSQLPNLLQSFVMNLHCVLIHWFNGVFNSSIYEYYKGNSEFNLFAQINSYPKFVSHGLTQHFILNFLLIIVFHLIAIAAYGVFKLLDRLLGNRGKTRLVSAVKKTIRAFEWNIAYYGFALFFVEIIFFACWNFFKSHTGFHLVNASLALSIIYMVIFACLMFFVVFIPMKSVEQLRERPMKRKWGFLYTNYRNTILRKNFEAIYHCRNLILILFLVFAFNSPMLQTVAMFLVAVAFFVCAWVLMKPWKSWVMWIIELIPEASLCLTLLGYLILAADDQNTSLGSQGRSSVGAFVVSMNFIGILANAVSIFFWFLFNWKYGSRVFKTYHLRPEMPELLFQSRELLALTVFKNGDAIFESNVLNAKAEPESSQRVHLNNEPHAKSDLDYPSIDKDHNLSIDKKPRFSDSEVLPKLSARESENIYRESKSPFKLSKIDMRGDHESVLTDEREPRDSRNHPARKVLNNSSVNDEEDSGLNASDSIDMGNFRRPPPNLADSNVLGQNRFLEEKKNPQNPQTTGGVTRQSNPVVIPQYNYRHHEDMRPMDSDEDYS